MFLRIAVLGLFMLPSAEPGHAHQRDAGDLHERPLRLPELRPGDKCPASVGSKDVVPHQSHIFGAGGWWFGAGPVLVNLAWKDSMDDRATFSLAPVPFLDDAYRAKTPWVSDPSYGGPILVRGRALDRGGRPLRFGVDRPRLLDRLELHARAASDGQRWSFWPTSMWVHGPGCYGLQIDTRSGTDVVVFDAK